MKGVSILPLVFALLAVSSRAADDFFDRLGENLTFVSPGGAGAARLSGTLDLEHYVFPHPAPGLVFASGNTLFNPRLSLYVDAQWGERTYVFAQGRVDRGFDPTAGNLQARIDEYAVRFAVLKNGRLGLQVGRFATVVGRWVRRHGSWEQPFVTAPLAYENLTGIWDSAAPRTTEVLLAWAHVRPFPSVPDEFTDKHLRLPMIWGPSYAHGVAAFGDWGPFDLAVEVKNAALSSRPEAWDLDRARWRHPTLSARLGYRPNVMWEGGLSASTGAFLDPLAARFLPPGRSLSDYRQTLLAADLSFASRRWEVWTEWAASRFQLAGVGNADTAAGFVEVKRKLAPQWSVAARLNRQIFGRLTDARGQRVKWGRELWRLDFAPTYRFSAHLQLKVQYSVERRDTTATRTVHTLSSQATLRF
ncbi:MAG: hypothetical protein U1F61_14895 [Opitutaceae bacterium]